MRRRRSSGPGAWGRLMGLAGVVCIGVAAAGLARHRGVPPPPGQAAATSAPQAASGLASAALSAPSYYPLEVGRYWRYVGTQEGETQATEVERRIVRCQHRPDGEVFQFADGTLVFQRQGRTFEVGTEGGVNVVPLGPGLQAQPYVYTSRGLRIEQQIGARDTLLVLGRQTYPGCVQVITRFQRPGDAESRSYASYYARGIGLVGREPWPSCGSGQLVVRLRDHGVQTL